MNIAIVKVVIQAFVDKHDLLRMPGSPEEQYGEVYGAAQDEGEEEEIGRASCRERVSDYV